MTERSDKTEVHEASDLKPATTSGVDPAQKGADSTGYTVSIEGTVYAVTANSATEAAEKAKKLHKNQKGSKS